MPSLSGGSACRAPPTKRNGETSKFEAVYKQAGSVWFYPSPLPALPAPAAALIAPPAIQHEFQLDRLCKPGSPFFISGTNKAGKQLEGLANAETRCNWSKVPILAALCGVQRLAWAGV
jgi:hypothetical protein